MWEASSSMSKELKFSWFNHFNFKDSGLFWKGKGKTKYFLHWYEWYFFHMPGSASLRNTSERVIIFLLICACKTIVCLNVSGYISYIVPRSPVQVEFESSQHLPRIIANQAAKHTACTEGWRVNLLEPQISSWMCTSAPLHPMEWHIL